MNSNKRQQQQELHHEGRSGKKRARKEPARQGAGPSRQIVQKENLPSGFQGEDRALVRSIFSDEPRTDLVPHLNDAIVFRPRTRDLWKECGPVLDNFHHHEDLRAHAEVRDFITVTFFKFHARAERFENERVRRGRAEARASGRTKAFSRRPLERTLSMMRAANLVRFDHQKVLGHVPGVAIGDTFTSRIQLHVVGLHKQIQAGIDTTSLGCEGKGKTKEGIKIATSIVLSGEYQDDLDDGDHLVYTGQGGNNLLGDKRQRKDQELKGPNLALARNAEYCVPVRLIRNHNTQLGKELIYDGLYDVKSYRKGLGKDGYYIFKYDLVRCPGQRERSSQMTVKWGGKGSGPKKARDFGVVVCKDISGGAESVPIPAVNKIDNMLPPGIDHTMIPSENRTLREWELDENTFQYSTRVFFHENVPKKSSPIPMKSPGANHSEVSKLNRLKNGNLPYKNGVLRGVTGILYECAPYMNCPQGTKCPQAITQRGLRLRLQLFKTSNRGWAIRTLEPIPPWTFICKYVGEIILIHGNNVVQDDYAIDLARRSDFDEEGKYVEENDRQQLDVQYAITGAGKGNVFRYINHSCDPNLYVQPVLSDHLNPWMPDISLFSLRPIRAYEELSYDYGRNFLRDRSISCVCGAAICCDRVIVDE